MNASITPLNETTASPVAQSKKTLWEQLLDALDEKRPIERLEKQGGVVLSREYNAQRKYAVWIKIYQSAKGNNLSVFNEWEFDLLSRAQNLSVQGCYKSAELIKSGSPIHTGDTPIHLRQNRQTVISTIHGGSDLGDWERMRLCVNRQPVPHPFVEPANFLRLARGALEALRHLHNQDFVHCDLNPGNLVLPSLIEGQNAANKTVTLRSTNLEKVKITPLWDKLILIDLGYSLSRKIEPYTTLPLDTNVSRNPRMSAHLRQRLDDIEQKAKQHLSLTNSQKTWENVRFDKAFWSQWKGSPLGLLQKLDWREDLHQLGFLLKDIRDSWGGGEHIKLSNLILSQLIYSLPERLLEWGNAAQLDRPAPEMPHLQLISEIEYALAQAQDKDRQDTFFLYRVDNDSDYAVRQKRGEERRQHWLRRWRNAMVLRDKLPHLIQNAWVNIRNTPFLAIMALSYPVFVFLAIALGKDPIGLPLGGTAAMVLVIVLGLATWKLTGLLIRGTVRRLLEFGALRRRLALGLGIHLRKSWHNAIELGNKLLHLTQNAWDNFFDSHPFLDMTVGYYLPCFLCFAFLSMDFTIVGRHFSGMHLTKIELIIFPLGYATMMTLAVVLVGAVSVNLEPLQGRLILALSGLLRRMSNDLRIFFTSRYLYPILLIPLAWGAESQYDLTAKTEKTYTTWQTQRYVESAKQIEKSDWWLGSRAANVQETEWILTTEKLADQGVPYAQFEYAMLHCYGMHNGSRPHFQGNNASECGDKLGTALRDGRLDKYAGDPVDLPAMTNEIYHLLRNTAYREHPVEGSDALLRALAPELSELTPYHAKLAFLLADIQACRFGDAVSARRTLQEIVTSHPDTEEAKQAVSYLPRLKVFCPETKAKSGELHAQVKN